MAKFRVERVSELLHNFLSQQLRNCRDPRLECVYITGVEPSPDLRFAKVFWSMRLVENLDEKAREVQQKASSQALEKASGMFKRAIASDLDLRYVPQLTFKFDDSERTGSRIDQLLHEAGL